MDKTSEFEAVIGLEVHIQLLTESKAFSGDSTGFGAPPNSQTSIISLAHPGTLPRPNKKQVEYAIRLGLALDCEINLESYFDRKHYFYADLPKGFQTTQDKQPICLGGRVEFRIGDQLRMIRLNHIHMEEDAGKSLHEMDTDFSYIDLNRAGIPLLEMVTEPDFRSGEEVYYFINELRRLVRFLGISDGNMEEGSLRCDCNISVRQVGQTSLNARCEIKNINSARFARKAIEYEIERQTKLMENGENIKQETREFLPEPGITVALRSKEDAHDYRYFPEPDILPIRITKNKLESIRRSMPILPNEFRRIFIEEFDLSAEDTEIIIENYPRAVSFMNFIREHPSLPPKLSANFFINKWYPGEDAGEVNQDFDRKYIVQFLELIEEKKISASIAYQRLWPELIKKPQDVFQLCQNLNLLQSNDLDEIRVLAEQVLRENPDQLEKYNKGKKGIITFFMGQLMRKSRGKANPEMAREVLEKLLES